MADLKEIHDKLHAAINDIDRKLDSRLDPSVAGKRTLINERIESTKDSWEDAVNGLLSQLAEADIDTQIGAFHGILKNLNENFKDKVNTALEELVKNAPKPTPLIEESEVEGLSKTRSDLYGKVKQLIEMAKPFGDDEGMYMPSKRTGKSGKRGKRQLSYFNFYIGDKKFETLKEVAEAYPAVFEKAADITKALRAGTKNAEGETIGAIDTTNPPDVFEFLLPDGEVLTGRREKDDSDVSDPNGQDDEDNENGDEDSPESDTE